MIILDFGSGNTCKNDEKYIIKMIDELAAVDITRRCIIKWQLFLRAGNNIPLDKNMFYAAYSYASKLGFKTTASVFDISSLGFLLQFDIPFVKLANNPDLWGLIQYTPRNIPVVYSVREDLSRHPRYTMGHDIALACISKYPAQLKEYDEKFSYDLLMSGISDHTIDWDLYKMFKPKNYECHFKLDDSTGLDAGPFARTPKMLKEILNAD